MSLAAAKAGVPGEALAGNKTSALMQKLAVEFQVVRSVQLVVPVGAVVLSRAGRRGRVVAGDLFVDGHRVCAAARDVQVDVEFAAGGQGERSRQVDRVISGVRLVPVLALASRFDSLPLEIAP